MHDIDFLPAAYRQKFAQRQSQPWQAVVATIAIGLVAAAAAAQQYHRHSLQADLAILTPAYKAATDLQNRLAEFQKQWKSAEAGAELYTYLRHPWPRTQLLTALASPLPESITLQQLQILREAVPVRLAAEMPVAADKKSEETRQKSLAPAERDLAQLTSRMDRLQTTIVLAGLARDDAALHRYIADLNATDIFERADLDSVNSLDNGPHGAALQFRAVLIVQPGYGQPGGLSRIRHQGSAARSPTPRSS